MDKFYNNLDFRRLIVKSMTIEERLNAFKDANRNLNISSEYIDNWIKRKSLINEQTFDLKLKTENISREEFNYAIKELTDVDKDMLFIKLENFEWYKKFVEIFEYFSGVKDIDFETEGSLMSFYYALRPFVFWAKNEMKNFIETLVSIKVSESALADIFLSIQSNLYKISQKSFIFELHEYKKMNELKGETSEHRFKEFLRLKFGSIEGLIGFYSEYACLSRILTEKVSFLVKNIKKTLSDIDANILDIEKDLNIKIDNKSIKNVYCNEGDSHQKGKSVIQIVFNDGTKLVYKPKNLKIQKKYYEFINYINKNSTLLDLPINKCFCLEDFTIEKFIEYKECINEEEVIKFYKRFGQTIAVMYILFGADFHAENVIASGEYIYIIDLETIFQHTPQLKFEETADVNAKNKLVNSVLFSGLLPFVAFKDNLEGKGIDLSALKGDEQKLPFKILAPVAQDTDEMVLDYQDYTRPGAKNIPKCNGIKVNFAKYTDYIVEGFRKMCIFILENKHLFLSDDSIIYKFGDLQVRYLSKSTQRYASMLDYSYHPKYTKDSIEREKLFENIWAYPYINKEIILYETRDLFNDDIPIFFNCCNSKDIITSDGKIIKNYLNTTSLEMVIERIKTLSIDEIERQISYIRVIFGEYLDISEKIIKETNKHYNNLKNKKVLNEINFLDESIKIADYIMRNAIYSSSNELVTWIDVNIEDPNNMNIEPLNENFYNGLAGLAFYFYQLFKITQNDLYYIFSKKILASSIERSVYSNNVTAFTGKASLLFTLLDFYINEKEKKYLDDIENVIKYVEENMDKIKSIDWISGYSGLIHNFINVYRTLHLDRSIDILKKLGNRLLKNLSNIELSSLLGGMAHGTSGISVALFELGAVLDDSIYTEEAIRLLQYDRKLYDDKKRGWIDKTNDDIADRWCHGSTGIGISRLMIMRYYRDALMSKEINLSLKIAYENMKDDDCLCHGNFGDIELMLYYYLLSDDRVIKQMMSEKIKKIFDYKYNMDRFKVTSIPYLTTYGLFNGFSGIGYELLRLNSPHMIPSVLTMEIDTDLSKLNFQYKELKFEEDKI